MGGKKQVDEMGKGGLGEGLWGGKGLASWRGKGRRWWWITTGMTTYEDGEKEDQDGLQHLQAPGGWEKEADK